MALKIKMTEICNTTRNYICDEIVFEILSYLNIKKLIWLCGHIRPWSGIIIKLFKYILNYKNNVLFMKGSTSYNSNKYIIYIAMMFFKREFKGVKQIAHIEIKKKECDLIIKNNHPNPIILTTKTETRELIINGETHGIDFIEVYTLEKIKELTGTRFISVKINDIYKIMRIAVPTIEDIKEPEYHIIHNKILFNLVKDDKTTYFVFSGGNHSMFLINLFEEDPFKSYEYKSNLNNIKFQRANSCTVDYGNNNRTYYRSSKTVSGDMECKNIKKFSEQYGTTIKIVENSEKPCIGKIHLEHVIKHLTTSARRLLKGGNLIIEHEHDAKTTEVKYTFFSNGDGVVECKIKITEKIMCYAVFNNLLDEISKLKI